MTVPREQAYRPPYLLSLWCFVWINVRLKPLCGQVAVMICSHNNMNFDFSLAAVVEFDFRDMFRSFPQ